MYKVDIESLKRQGAMENKAMEQEKRQWEDERRQKE